MHDEFTRFMEIASSLPASAYEVSVDPSRGQPSVTLRLLRAGVAALIARWDSGPAYLRQDLESAQAKIRDLELALRDELRKDLYAEIARRTSTPAEDLPVDRINRSASLSPAPHVREYLREQRAGLGDPTSAEIEADTGGDLEGNSWVALGYLCEQPPYYRVPPVAKPGDPLAAGWIYSDLDDEDPGLLHVLADDLVARVRLCSYGRHTYSWISGLYDDRASGRLEHAARSNLYPVAYVGTQREGLRERFEAAPKVPPATSADEGFRPGWIYGLDDPRDPRLALPRSAREVHWLRTSDRRWVPWYGFVRPSPRTFALGFRPMAWVGDVDPQEALTAAKELGL